MKSNAQLLKAVYWTVTVVKGGRLDEARLPEKASSLLHLIRYYFLIADTTF